MNTFITNLQEIRKKIKLQKSSKKASQICYKKNNIPHTKIHSTKILFSAILILGLNFNLYAEVLYLDIIVEAAKDESTIKDLPVGVQVIKSEDIEKLNPKKLDDVLNFKAGITEAGKQGEIGSSTSLRIRGNGSNYSLVLIDGQPINSASLGSADFSFIDLDMIDRIEIIKGPYSTVLGNGAVGGVVNIITKDGYKTDGHSGTRKIDFGSYGYQNIAFNDYFNQDKTKLATNLNLGKYDGKRENSEYDYQNFFMKLDREINDTSNLDFRYIYNKRHLGVPGSGVGLADYDGTKENKASTPNENMEYESHYLQTNYKIIKENIGEFNFRIYNNLDEQTDKDTDTHPALYQFTAKNDFFKSAKYGVEGKLNTENNWLIGVQTEYDEAKYDNRETSLEIYDYSRSINSVYLQKTLKLNSWTNIIGGRYDYTSRYGDGFSPKLTSIFNVNDNVRLSANIAKSFRVLSFSEIYYAGNNLKYKYEDGIGGDFGIEFGLFDKKANMQIVYFAQEIDNKISWADWLNPKQVQKSKSNGIETSLDFATGIFSHTINYTYTEAKSKETEASEYLNDSYIPHNKASYILAGNLPKAITFSAAAKYTGEQKWIDSYGSKYRLAEYWIFDINLTKSFKKFDVYFNVDNIFDTDYQYRIGYPTTGREFRIGTKFKF